MATFLDINQADASELKLIWLLFPTWAEELSFLHCIQSKTNKHVSGVSFIEGDYSGYQICSFVVGVGKEAQQFCLQLSKLILENGYNFALCNYSIHFVRCRKLMSIFNLFCPR